MKVTDWTMLILLVISINYCSAQDKIVLNNGQRIKATNVEVREAVILYNYFNRPDEEPSIIRKSEVARIAYKNGENLNIDAKTFIREAYDSDDSRLRAQRKWYGTIYFYDSKQVRKRDMIKILKTNPSAYNMYLSGRNKDVLGLVLGVPSGLIFGAGTRIILGGGEVKKPIYIASGIIGLASMVMQLSGKDEKLRAINYYNSPQSGVDFGIEATENGLGLVVSF